MDFNKIETNYPKAYKQMVEYYEEWYFAPYSEDVLTGRILYDFFDEQEIYVTIKRSHGFDADICEGCECYPYIEANRELSKLARDRHKVSHFKTRFEAETAVFTKAFEILENKLNKNKK